MRHHAKPEKPGHQPSGNRWPQERLARSVGKARLLLSATEQHTGRMKQSHVDRSSKQCGSLRALSPMVMARPSLQWHHRRKPDTDCAFQGDIYFINVYYIYKYIYFLGFAFRYFSKDHVIRMCASSPPTPQGRVVNFIWRTLTGDKFPGVANLQGNTNERPTLGEATKGTWAVYFPNHNRGLVSTVDIRNDSLLVKWVVFKMYGLARNSAPEWTG